MAQRVIIFIICTAGLLSCVFKNDMDYPLIPGNIIVFSVEGQKNVIIDNKSRNVSVELEETAEIANLKITGFQISDGAVLSEPLGQYINLSSPVKILLKTYQDYEWTISAEQNIERYVKCDNQINSAVFNEESLSIIIYVTDTQPLSKIKINSMKLGPEGSEIVSTTGFYKDGEELKEKTEECNFPMTLDCVLERTFKVMYKGKEFIWKLKALQIESKVEIVSVSPRCYHAKVKAGFSGKGSPVLEYKKASESQWTKIEELNIAGVGVSATIKNLEADTNYKIRISEEGEYSPDFDFRTESPLQLSNMSFDAWHLQGKTWYPYAQNAQDSQKAWDSANKATSQFIGSTTTPEENFLAASGAGKKAAKLESRFAVVKFAAGSIFVGKFVGLVGMGAELSWGVPFVSRPAALRGHYSYSPAIINYTDEAHASLKGQEDSGHIIFILTDWDKPFSVISSKNQFVDFDNDPAIIAYGKLTCDKTNGVYKEFTLPIEYRSDRTPKWVSIIASSSALGDYFTGGTGSVLYLDEFSLEYD